MSKKDDELDRTPDGFAKYDLTGKLGEDSRPAPCSRDEFETWWSYVRHGHAIDLSAGPDGNYLDPMAGWAWTGWRGREFTANRQAMTPTPATDVQG